MILQLREIFQIEGMHLPVSYEITPEELSEVRGYTFAAPVAVSGEFYNRAGIVTLKYTVSCTLDVVCDRCLTELKRDYSYDFSHMVVPSLQSEGDIYDTYLVAQHDSIDMNETAISDLLLMLPTKMLCREDCKGLCDICGCNLNERTCNCRK
ncbi:YceD family protein [Ruminococcus sp.]|uniref:YceD family protein n=1 Tax=Ruminococcus sp. TaxID=41978 RepID=UPI0039947034